MESLPEGASRWSSLTALEVASCHMSLDVGLVSEGVWPELRSVGLDCSDRDDTVAYEGLFEKPLLRNVTLCGGDTLDELPYWLVSCTPLQKLTLYAPNLKVVRLEGDSWNVLEKLKLVGCSSLASLPPSLEN
jgi:hypothetical protein